jgi:hypothetical protein
MFALSETGRSSCDETTTVVSLRNVRSTAVIVAATPAVSRMVATTR